MNAARMPCEGEPLQGAAHRCLGERRKIVAPLLKRNRPASRANAERLDSAFGKRTRIMAQLQPRTRAP